MRAELDSMARMTLLRPGPGGVRVIAVDGAGFIRAATQGPTDRFFPNAPGHGRVTRPERNPSAATDLGPVPHLRTPGHHERRAARKRELSGRRVDQPRQDDPFHGVRSTEVPPVDT